ncbi:MAG TPA: hypothetical protein VNT42_09320, partial [Sphingomonas sp.]|nr:hypothetical protein [Sphingomonas sp.]
LAVGSHPGQFQAVWRPSHRQTVHRAQQRNFPMVRKTGLAAIALALAAGTIVANPADARIALNRISLNRISANRIAFNGLAAKGAKVDQTTANPHAKEAVPARKTQPGEGSVSAVVLVELPSQ